MKEQALSGTNEWVQGELDVTVEKDWQTGALWREWFKKKHVLVTRKCDNIGGGWGMVSPTPPPPPQKIAKKQLV